MSSVLVVGATRGLGAELVKQYASKGSTVYGTSRSDKKPDGFPKGVKWLYNIDLTNSKVADELVKQLKGEQPLDTVVSASHRTIKVL